MCNRINRTTRGNTQWRIDGASRWVSTNSKSTVKGSEAWSLSDKVRALAHGVCVCAKGQDQRYRGILDARV